jgi:ABC-type uncharacterized transport system ATPase subunit
LSASLEFPAMARELTEALLGQRRIRSGEIRVNGKRYLASRRQMQREGSLACRKNRCATPVSPA